MKKKLFVLITSLMITNLFSNTFQIQDVNYEIKGRTRESIIKKNFPIDQNKIFNTKEELEEYISDLSSSLSNTRVFEDVEISYTEEIPTQSETDSNTESLIPINLTIKLSESFSFLAVPYFKYDSNSGTTFKVKAKDYNFLGTLNPMNVDINFKLINNEETNEEGSQIGINFSYDHPFQIKKINLTWFNDYSFDYTFKKKIPEWNANTGLNVEIPIKNKNLYVKFIQGFTNNFDYKPYDDEIYFSENLSISLPIKLTENRKIGSVTYTPNINFNYYWDINGISKNNSGLYCPRLSVGHSLSLGKVNWVENFRRGFSLSISNSYSYNWIQKEVVPYVNFEINSHFNFVDSNYAFLRRLGINANVYGFLYIPLNHKYYYGEQYGDNLRGIRDEQYFSSDIPEFSSEKALSSFTAITLCLDFPFKLFETNFTKKFFNYFNFELQVAPFIDISLGYNRYTKRYFHPKDGFYTAGMEILVYPRKWSSVTVRGSFGIDMGRFLNIVDTSWRKKVSLYEFSFGLGLHY